jgi:hypothetical protein
LANDQFWIDMFDRTANHKVAWRMTASDLLSAADALFNAYRTVDISSIEPGAHLPVEHQFLSPLLLLRAAGVECLLKAVALARGHVLAQNGEFIPPKGGKSHDLQTLADTVKFDVLDAERDLLRRLSLYMTIGRYPIHLRWDKGLRASSLGNGDKVHSLYWSTPHDEETFSQLLGRLCSASQ